MNFQDLVPYTPALTAFAGGSLAWFAARRGVSGLAAQKESEISLYKQNVANLTKQLHAARTTQPVPTGVPGLDSATQEKLAQFEHLSRSYSQLHHAYTALRASSVERAELDAINHALAAKERENATLTARHSNMVREVEYLRQRQTEENQNLRNLQDELDAAKARLAHLEDSTATAAVPAPRTVVDTATLHAEQHAVALADLLNERDSAQEQLAIALQEIEQLRSGSAQQPAELQQAKTQVHALSLEVQELKQERERWLDELAATPLVTEEELRRVTEAHETALAELHADIESAHAERDELRAQLEAMQDSHLSPSDMQRVEHQLKALTEEHARLMDDFAHAEDALRAQAQVSEEHEQLVEDLSELRSEREELRNQIEELHVEVEKLETQLGTAEQTLAEAQEQAATLRTQHSALEQDYAQYRSTQVQQCSILQTQTTAAQTQLGQLSTLRDSLIQELYATRRLQQRLCDDLKNEHHEKQTLRQHLKDQQEAATWMQGVIHAMQAENQQTLSQRDQMLLCLHTLRTEKAQMLDAHATALQAKEERMATELDQIRLAIASVQSSAHDAAGRMDDQWVEICSELEQLKDTLYITQAENDQLRCDMLAAEERLALAESVSLRAQAELESICNDLTAATSIEQESEHPCTGQTAADLLGSAAETAPAQQGVPQYQAASRMVGVYQGSAIVFVYETDTLTGPVYRKAVLMQEEGSAPSLRAAPTSLLGEGLQLLQAGSPAQVNTPAADEPLTAQSLNEALLRALTRAEEQVSRRAESKRLYHKAISQFAAAKGSLPATESSIASDAAMQLSRMLMEDQDVTGCMDAARLATDWARQGYGEQSAAVADAQRWLAQLLLQQGRVDDGMAAYRQTLTIRERTLGSAHPDTQAARSVLDTLAQQLAISA